MGNRLCTFLRGAGAVNVHIYQNDPGNVNKDMSTFDCCILLEKLARNQTFLFHGGRHIRNVGGLSGCKPYPWQIYRVKRTARSPANACKVYAEKYTILGMFFTEKLN